MTTKETEQNALMTTTIRVLKEHSSFLYFTFEASEGIAFYSTKEDSAGMPYRDIELNHTPEYNEAVISILNKLSERFTIDWLES